MKSSIKFTEASQQILIRMLNEKKMYSGEIYKTNFFDLDNDLYMEVSLLSNNKFAIHIGKSENIGLGATKHISTENRYSFTYYIDSNTNEITEYYSNGTCSIKSFIETINKLDNFLNGLF